MKKTLVLFFVILLISAGAFYYFNNVRSKKIDSWKMVPSNAIIAFENNSLIENWNEIVNKTVWKTLKKMPYFQSWEISLAKADSLSGKEGMIDKLFRKKQFIISVHITASDEFDFLFTLDLIDRDGKEVFNNLIESILRERSLIAKSRAYLGHELHELVSKKDETTFTYFLFENIVIGSFTPFLVEDAVRNVSEDFNDTFKNQIVELDGVSKLENDEGNIYIDFAKLPGFLASFLKEGHAQEIGNIAQFSNDTYLDIKVTDNEILLNGISAVDLSSNDSFLGTFRNQDPGRNEVTDLLPNSTAVLYHVTFSDFRQWQSQLTKYWSKTDNEQFQRSLDVEEKYDLKFDWIEREAANAILETPHKEQADQLVFVGIRDQDVVFTELSRFAEQISREADDSLYIEIYDDRPIVQIPFSEFPAIIMGNYFSGFENSFVMIYEKYLVIGNTMQVIKLFINELENENNWGKSVRQNLFMENTLSESSFSIIVNTSLCWQMIMDKLNSKWVELFSAHQNPLKSFDRIAFQVSNLDQRFYTSLAIGHQEQKVAVQKTRRLKRKQSVYTLSPIITKPYIVKNHNNNRFEVLVQDSSNILYQISNEGEILWGDSIQDPIVSEIHQIDFYKNGKLQYLFATADKIHLLDRNGDYVENFPIVLKNKILEHLSVIDYDNSKRYRFMAIDKSGNIYLFDKRGNNLDGWKPRSVGGQLATPSFHIRVRGGDCMVALQSNGTLNVMNRRGEMYPGFPIDLKCTRTTDLFVNIGNDFNSTRLITVSDEGEIIEVNLKGSILRREQLYKPTRESKFWLVNDALNKTYVIARQEYSKISILDRKGELILEKNIISSGDLKVQYYNFSTENQIIVVIDREQEFAYVFKGDGEQITFEPLESGHPIGLIYSDRQKEYLIYKCFGNNFSIESFE